jgi:hypothetical protein
MAAKDDHSTAFLKAVLQKGNEKGYTHQEIAASLFAEVAAAAAPFSAALAMVVDYYLDDANGASDVINGEVSSDSVRGALG